MRSRKQTPPELNGDHVDESAVETDSPAVDALELAEEAEAEAAEAEAAAAAARARARPCGYAGKPRPPRQPRSSPRPRTTPRNADDSARRHRRKTTTPN